MRFNGSAKGTVEVLGSDAGDARSGGVANGEREAPIATIVTAQDIVMPRAVPITRDSVPLTNCQLR